MKKLFVIVTLAVATLLSAGAPAVSALSVASAHSATTATARIIQPNDFCAGGAPLPC